MNKGDKAYVEARRLLEEAKGYFRMSDLMETWCAEADNWIKDQPSCQGILDSSKVEQEMFEKGLVAEVLDMVTAKVGNLPIVGSIGFNVIGYQHALTAIKDVALYYRRKYYQPPATFPITSPSGETIHVTQEQFDAMKGGA
jgi:hypothetical protein